MMNRNFIDEQRRLEFLETPNDLKIETNFMNVNSCNQALCNESFTSGDKTINTKETISEIFKAKTNEMVNNNTMKLVDKNVMGENFNLDFKFKSYEKMENHECLTCKRTFNNENVNNSISDASKDSDTLIIYIDESDIDDNTSDDEEVKNINGNENCAIGFEEHQDNYQISQLQEICIHNDSYKNSGNIISEDHNSKIDVFHVCNCENASKRPRIDQQHTNIKNAHISHEIHDLKINFLHRSNSKEILKVPNTDQHLVNINKEDPDVLKIFYDESDIDEDYKPDSNINEKNEEIIENKPLSNKKCTTCMKYIDTSLSTIDEANYTNGVANDNNGATSELNSFNNSGIVHTVENTILDYQKEDLINTGRNKLKKNEAKSELNTSGVFPSVENTTSDHCGEEDLVIIERNKLTVNRVQSNSLNTSGIIHNFENTIPVPHEEDLIIVYEAKSKLNSLNTSEIIPCVENTTSDHYGEKEDLINTERRKLKENEIKSELNTLNTSGIIPSVENTIPDYYEDEKEDLISSEWNKIKSLSTDEERYKQVSNCWQSPSIPDPNKDLTYYSFRKRIFSSKGDDINERKPIKRPASSNLDDRDTKHARSCTYIADDRIKTIESERNVKIKKLKEEFDSKINKRYENHGSLERRLAERHFKTYGTFSNYVAVNGGKLKRIRDQFEKEIKNMEIRYKKQLKSLENLYISRINASYKRRKEIMQFCNFYKMSKTNSGKDPTLLTRQQQSKLDEIENIYKQLDFFYK